MIRDTEKIIKVDKTIQEEVILNQEEITKYTVDKREESLLIEVRLTGDETSRVDIETHRFFTNDFINEPIEADLWQLIDKKRSGE